MPLGQARMVDTWSDYAGCWADVYDDDHEEMQLSGTDHFDGIHDTSIARRLALRHNQSGGVWRLRGHGGSLRRVCCERHGERLPRHRRWDTTQHLRVGQHGRLGWERPEHQAAVHLVGFDHRPGRVALIHDGVCVDQRDGQLLGQLPQGAAALTPMCNRLRTG
jgi:hypothetical protein